MRPPGSRRLRRNFLILRHIFSIINYIAKQYDYFRIDYLSLSGILCEKNEYFDKTTVFFEKYAKVLQKYVKFRHIFQKIVLNLQIFDENLAFFLENCKK